MEYSIDLGGISVHLVSGGRNRVDGGGMLGILPKIIWNRWYPADKKNRIHLETHCLLVKKGTETILIETGCGNKLNDKEKAFYSVEDSDWIGANLANIGVPPEDVNKVLLTHLHTDHAGGCVTRDSSGKLVSTFPNAEFFVSKKEWEVANSGSGITPNAYNNENYQPLEEAGQLRIVSEDAQICPGVRFLPTPGHTLGHVSILIEGQEKELVFTGDLLPLAKQIVPHYNMAYDTDPVLKAKTKQTFFREACDKEWILAMSHEPATPICRIVEEKETGRYVLENVGS